MAQCCPVEYHQQTPSLHILSTTVGNIDTLLERKFWFPLIDDERRLGLRSSRVNTPSIFDYDVVQDPAEATSTASRTGMVVKTNDIIVGEALHLMNHGVAITWCINKNSNRCKRGQGLHLLSLSREAYIHIEH